MKRGNSQGINQITHVSYLKLILIFLIATISNMTCERIRNVLGKNRKFKILSSTLISRNTRLFSSQTDIDVNTVSYDNFSFELHKESKDSKARLATISTPHGIINTPNFVFCATKATMKGLTPDQVRNEGSQIILSNTYHLMITPGSELIEKMGGLQKFTNWNGPMLTDSGGYQIFSMGHGSVSNEIKGKRNVGTLGWDESLISIDENGATFKSYLDGSIHNLTPEKSIEIQRQLGADLIVVLDECTPFNVDKNYTAASMHRSHRWATRSLQEFIRTQSGKQALYGIIQGGIYEDLRIESTDFINNLNVFGIAIGGSLGATRKDMHEIVSFTRARIRNDKPIHLLGIGGVRDIFHGVRQGIDTFDCVHPTRLGRHGGALVPSHHWHEEALHEEGSTVSSTVDSTVSSTVRSTPAIDNANRKAEEKRFMALQSYNQACMHASANGLPAPALPKRLQSPLVLRTVRPIPTKRTVREHINVTKAPFRSDPRPIDPTCTCYTCKHFSRAYLHHLFKAKETLGGTLTTLHNVHFMNRLMGDIRRGIRDDTLDEVEDYFVHADLKHENNDREENIPGGIGS